jgi:hypothetical protein
MASITIPAAHLDVARGAVIGRIRDDSDWIKDVAGSPGDLQGACRALHEDLAFAERLDGAETDTDLVEGDPRGGLVEALLEDIVRESVAELQNEEMQYAPLQRAQVIAIVDRICWALTELGSSLPVKQSDRRAA